MNFTTGCKWLSLFFMMGCATANTIYQDTTEAGVRRYSDRPSTTAAPIEITPTPTITLPQPTPAPTQQAAPVPAQPTYQLHILYPTHEMTLQHDVDSLMLRFDITPPLNQGHTIGLRVNDTIQPKRYIKSPIPLPRLYRGSHDLELTVYDAQGDIVARSKTITVHQRRPRVTRR